MNAFCASENFDTFIVFRSFPALGNDRKTLAHNGPVLRDQSTFKQLETGEVALTVIAFWGGTRRSDLSNAAVVY
jgi:hypothetical protein